jgi:hypothetical protein
MATALNDIARRQASETGADPDLIFRFEAQLNVVPVGLTPEGLRMANSYEGRVTAGRLRGARVWGTDHLLLRSDGVCVIDAQTMLSQDGSRHVYEHVYGYCLPPEGLQIPPLQTLVEPGFEWPDVDFPIVGFSTFRSGAREFDDLNSVTARIDGWANFATGGLAIDTRLVPHDGRVPRPTRRR